MGECCRIRMRSFCKAAGENPAALQVKGAIGMNVGIKGNAATSVEEENTAAAMGSGNLEVFATPAMVALMEQAACESVQPYLHAGESTVGTRMQVSHISATPVGMQVTVESELTAIDRKGLTFTVKAYDSAGLIGEGVHERFIINADRFMEKAAQKYNEDRL